MNRSQYLSDNKKRMLGLVTAFALTSALETLAQEPALSITKSTNNTVRISVTNATLGNTYHLLEITYLTPGENQGHYWVTNQTAMATNNWLSFTVPMTGAQKFYQVKERIQP